MASAASSSGSSSRAEDRVGLAWGGSGGDADPGPNSGSAGLGSGGGLAAGGRVRGGNVGVGDVGSVGVEDGVPKLKLTAANLKPLGGRDEEAFAESSDEEVDQREGFFARTTQKVTSAAPRRHGFRRFSDGRWCFFSCGLPSFFWSAAGPEEAPEAGRNRLFPVIFGAGSHPRLDRWWARIQHVEPRPRRRQVTKHRHFAQFLPQKIRFWPVLAADVAATSASSSFCMLLAAGEFFPCTGASPYFKSQGSQRRFAPPSDQCFAVRKLLSSHSCRDVDVVVFRRGASNGNGSCNGSIAGLEAGATQIKSNQIYPASAGDKNNRAAAPSFVSPESATVRRWLAKKQDRQAVDIPRFALIPPSRICTESSPRSQGTAPRSCRNQNRRSLTSPFSSRHPGILSWLMDRASGSSTTSSSSSKQLLGPSLRRLQL